MRKHCDLVCISGTDELLVYCYAVLPYVSSETWPSNSSTKFLASEVSSNCNSKRICRSFRNAFFIVILAASVSNHLSREEGRSFFFYLRRERRSIRLSFSWVVTNRGGISMNRWGRPENFEFFKWESPSWCSTADSSTALFGKAVAVAWEKMKWLRLIPLS